MWQITNKERLKLKSIQWNESEKPQNLRERERETERETESESDRKNERMRAHPYYFIEAREIV